MPMIVADTVQSTVDFVLGGITSLLRHAVRWFRRAP
jgi:hypothetical protein